jgi:hypothetical protein
VNLLDHFGGVGSETVLELVVRSLELSAKRLDVVADAGWREERYIIQVYIFMRFHGGVSWHQSESREQKFPLPLSTTA